MKTLTLNLNKKLLIVDYEDKQKLDEFWTFVKSFGMPKSMIKGKPCQPVFKGTLMTEEDYRSLIVDTYGRISISKHPKAYLVSYSRHKNAFTDLIEKEGFYWLENPSEEPVMEKYGWYSSNSQEEESGWMYEEGEAKYYEVLKEYDEAESRTFKYPIIFEILE